MKIAVVGAGIFGSTVAIKLAKNGYDVSLFEKEDDILKAASGINQYRLHRGYHYPRSKDTALSSKNSENSFRSEYGDAVLDHNEHYYCIARDGSKVSGMEFLQFCRDCDLEFEEKRIPYVNNHIIDFSIKGKESIIDPVKLRKIVKGKIVEGDIRLLLGETFSHKHIDDFSFVVNCTYANLNFILERYPEARRNYQFEVCEKLVLKLPEKFRNKSIVVLDGPFFCIDPYSDTGFHVMGNVVHAIHKTNTGLFPEIPEDFLPFMNNGIIKNPSISNVQKFLESASYFMPEMEYAEHIGSMFTVRTVLPNVHKTDERPTLVDRINDKIINVFSGKIGNSVNASEQVLSIVGNK